MIWSQLRKSHCRSMHRCLLSFLTLFLALLPYAVLAQGQGVVGRGEELWVEVLDAKGRPVEDLVAADLQVVEAGSKLLPLSLVSPGLGEGQAVVIYFDQTLSSQGSLLRAAQALGALGQQLTDLGEVRVILADPLAEEDLVTSDSLALSERLAWLSTNGSGRGSILELREATLERLRAAAGSEEGPAEMVRGAIEEEVELVRAQQDRLLAQMANGGRGGLLLLISDGYDLDPLSFYLRHLPETASAQLLRSASQLPGLEISAADLAKAMATLGWTTLPIHMEASGLASASVPDPAEVVDSQGRSTVVGGLRVGELLRRRQEKKKDRQDAEGQAGGATAAATLIAASEPLESLALAGGGELVRSEGALADALTRFAGRHRLTYLSSVSPGEPREIEVRAERPGLVVKSRRWVAQGSPPSLVAARLRALLEGVEIDGGLDLSAALRISSASELAGVSEASRGDLEARLSLLPLAGEAPVGQGSLLVSVATSLRGEEPRIHQELVEPGPQEGRRDWVYRAPLELPAKARQVAVMVEEPGGRWGAALASVVQSHLADGEESLPAPPVVEILEPDKKLLRGRTKFELDIYDPQVARVTYLLDDRQVAERDSPPFHSRVDLGDSPRRQTLAVVAYDADGQELGRDSVVLNAGTGGFGVRLVEPVSTAAVGPVDVAADVAVPSGRRVDRVLFFWNNEPAATLYRPPFRQRIRIPEDQPMGYIRAVAMLDDGSVVEDVIFMNGPEAGERVEVRLVEMNVVVTDRNGRPVRGLTQGDFRIREEGNVQEIAVFSDADDLPITLGMAIDSSASMFVKLPQVQQAARRFLGSSLAERDRAFVVDFDSQPRLARGTTGDLERVVGAIDRLEAGGSTALWESIVFSLVQLQGVRGRKALVVFSDGADEDEEFPFRSCMSFAKKMGVPIYLILMKHEPKDKSSLSLWTRSFGSRVDRLMGAVGGRVFYAKDYPNLDEVYDAIEEELRSQYLLAYYPSDTLPGDAWRDVNIEVNPKGLTPRTLTGYWQ